MRHALPLLLLAACNAPAGDDADGDEADSDAPVGGTTWFVGTTTFLSPSGSELGVAPSALARTVDPDAGTIELTRVEATADGPPFDLVITYDVDADAGTFSGAYDDGYGTFEVQGTFTAGEPWAWTAWTTTQTYADGPYVGSHVETKDRLTASGYRSDRSVFSPEGHHEADMATRLDVVDEADFDAAVADLRDGG